MPAAAWRRARCCAPTRGLRPLRCCPPTRVGFEGSQEDSSLKVAVGCLVSESLTVNILHRAGATAGMLFVDSQDLDETSRAKLRDELRALLRVKVPHAYESFGQIEGRKFAYELFFAWDLPAVLEVVNEFGEAHDDVVRLGFHSFFREAAGLMMKQPEDD